MTVAQYSSAIARLAAVSGTAAFRLNQNQARAQLAPEQLAEPVAEIALAGNGHAAEHPDDIIPLDEEELNRLHKF